MDYHHTIYPSLDNTATGQIPVQQTLQDGSGPSPFVQYMYSNYPALAPAPAPTPTPAASTVINPSPNPNPPSNGQRPLAPHPTLVSRAFDISAVDPPSARRIKAMDHPRVQTHRGQVHHQSLPGRKRNGRGLTSKITSFKSRKGGSHKSSNAPDGIAELRARWEAELSHMQMPPPPPQAYESKQAAIDGAKAFAKKNNYVLVVGHSYKDKVGELRFVVSGTRTSSTFSPAFSLLLNRPTAD